MKKLIIILSMLLILCGCASTEPSELSVTQEATVSELPLDYSAQISDVESFLPRDSHVSFSSMDGITHIEVELFADSIFDDFGINIYKVHHYCTSFLTTENFDIQISVFNDSNYETWCYTYLSSADGFGTLIDKRGNHEKITEFLSLEAMRDYFPLLNRYLLEQNIDPEDLTLYNKIRGEIQNYGATCAEHDIVFPFVANQNNMSPSQMNFFLLEVENRIISGNAYSDRIPLTFPRSLTYNDSLDIEEIPEIIYTTTGSENGLSGNVYYVEGEVVRYEKYELKDKTVEDFFVIKTDFGEVIVLDIVDYTIDYGQKHHYSKAAMEAYQNATSHEDFCFPEIGQRVRAYCIYAGFSGLFELPIAYYGTTDYSNIG